MEQIVNNQAFKHIVEKIFLTLKYEDLVACELVNKSSGNVLKNPLFWLKKWKLKGLSKENEENWNKALRLTKDSELEKNIILYFRRVLLMGHASIDVPCYIDKDVVEKVLAEETNPKKNFPLEKLLKEYASLTHVVDMANNGGGGQGVLANFFALVTLQGLLNRNPHMDVELILGKTSSSFRQYVQAELKPKNPLHYGICQLLASSRKIPWPCQIIGAAEGGKKEFIHIFAPLIPNLDIKAPSSNPNATDTHRCTPIYMAAEKGYAEIVKFLIPLTDNPNASREDGKTPLDIATEKGHQEVINVLAPYVLK